MLRLLKESLERGQVDVVEYLVRRAHEQGCELGDALERLDRAPVVPRVASGRE